MWKSRWPSWAPVPNKPDGLCGRKAPLDQPTIACEPVWPSGKEPRFESVSALLFLQVMVCGHCRVTLSLTVNETLKWLPSLPILMQESFWWWQSSDKYITSLFPQLHTSSPLSPSLISLMVSVDVKHHVYVLTVYTLWAGLAWKLWSVDTVKWLCPSQLMKYLNCSHCCPFVMHKSVWWRQCSDRYIISLFSHSSRP